MAVAAEKDTCMVCIEPFTKQPHRKHAQCPYCDVKACVKCTQAYLVGTHEDAHCMGCRRGWTREVMDSILLSTWLNGEYKKHRQNVLLDREKSRLPAAQILVERRKEGQALEPERVVIADEIAELERQINAKRVEYYRISRRIEAYYRGEDPTQTYLNGGAEAAQERERRVFVMPCPATGCRGFLSQAYKCGVCDVYCCPDCREIKGFSQDDVHTCDPNTVATVRAMKKDTRPCPECGISIFKIEGCFAKDTPILQWDGSSKMSQDIQVGDELVGDDGTKRIVQTLMSGDDELFEIKQNKGETYIVNSKHTLVLKYSGDKTIHYHTTSGVWKLMWFDRTEKRGRSKNFPTMEEAKSFRDTNLTFPDEIEMTVDEFVKLDAWSKKYLMGYKSNQGVVWPEKNVSLDPYVLGLWLGDGTTGLPILASNDIEIQKYMIQWCKENDAEILHDEGVKFRIRRRGAMNYKNEQRKAIGAGASSDICKGCKTRKMEICDTTNIDEVTDTNDEQNRLTNPFTDYLKQYNVLNEKHIPKEYIMNSREIRLKLLAGIIDTDGHLTKEQHGKRVVITQTVGKLCDDIVLLARSLGFVVNVTVNERKNISVFGGEKKDYKSIAHINISGELLHEIPTILPRKKCISSKPNKDYYRTSIEVTSKGRGTYYGWNVDSNHRFLHNDFTVLRNCNQMFCTGCHTAFDWVSGKKITTGAIHNPHYFEYLRATNGGHMPRNPGDIPCAGNLPTAWTFDREVSRRFPHLAHTLSDWLFRALRVVHHIQQVEIPNQTNAAEDIDNTEHNVRYLTKEIDETRWKQLLQMREKRRIKRDEVRLRFEAFVGACADIFGRIMAEARRGDIHENTQHDGVTLRGVIPNNTKDKKAQMTAVCEQAKESLLALRTIFNEGQMDISKRYKCQVLQLDEKGLAIGRKKYTAGRMKKAKQTDGESTIGSESIDLTGEDESEDDTAQFARANQVIRNQQAAAGGGGGRA
jgi:hypothetical protein